MERRRYSQQRELIYQCLMQTREHPTAEMVYQALKPQHPKLSLGTVYRNLNQLAEAGVIVRMPFRVERYDGDISNHAHFCCEGCGRVFDLPMPEDHGDAQALCARQGFALRRETRIFYGLCGDCRSGGEEN